MGVLAHCAEQDVYSAGHLKTINKFRVILEAQQLCGPASMGTALPTLGFDATPPTSFSTVPSYHGSMGPGQMESSAGGFTAQPYSNTMMQLDPGPSVIPQYTSSFHTMSSMARSDTHSTDYSAPSNWMAAEPLSSSASQSATSMMDYFASPQQTTRQHYHPFLQEFYRYQEPSSQGHAGSFN
jgi:hypothetical protein